MTKHDWKPGDLIGYHVPGSQNVYLGILERRNTEYRPEYWFVTWEDGEDIGHSFNEEHFLRVVS